MRTFVISVLWMPPSKKATQFRFSPPSPADKLQGVGQRRYYSSMFLIHRLVPGDEELFDEAIERFGHEKSLAPERFVADPRAHIFCVTSGPSGESLGYAYRYE